MRKQYMILIIAIALVGAAIYQSTSNKAAKPPADMEVKPVIGYKAPDFELKTLDDSGSYRLSDFSSPVVINFWASWCDPCRIEAPDLVKLYDKYGDRLEILAINGAVTDKLENAKNFVDEFGFTFPVVKDDDKNNKVMDLYRAPGYPVTFFINQYGVIEDIVYGIIPSKELEKKFKKLASRA